MTAPRVPVFFNDQQLAFKPIYEWAFGKRIDHPETTARAESILGALTADGSAFQVRDPVRIPRDALRELHSYELLTLYETARQLPDDETFYPTVFPKIPGDPTNIQHAGSFCFDAGTPLNAKTWAAAAWSAACAKEAAVALEQGEAPVTYALSRPPGHHATRDLFGGYCYFNNAAIAARHFVDKGSRVVILDIDFHHGNGTQSLFWLDPRVLVISIHGDPREFFPYYAGFADETGEGAGRGFNLNIPLARGCDGQGYCDVLEDRVIGAIRNFEPSVLVLSAGLDTYEKDPIGRFALTTPDFYRVGELVGRLHLPTVVVQEGGYYTPDLGENARTLLHGLRDGQQAIPVRIGV